MTKEELAWAGFLYTGQNDRVRCEFCNLELQDWQETGLKIWLICKFFSTPTLSGFEICHLKSILELLAVLSSLELYSY